MLQPFLITNSLFAYVDGTLPCPPQYLPTTSAPQDKATTDTTALVLNPDYTTWYVTMPMSGC
jgi:hypothetical protein